VNVNVYGETGDTAKDSSELGLWSAGSLEGDSPQIVEGGMSFVRSYKCQPLQIVFSGS